MVSAERLRELLHYDPETGIFRWRNWRTGPAKETAGRPSQRYLQIQVDGRRYQAHRLAILYVTGVWPPDVVDHIDGDGFNNRIANLRSATKSQNLHNRRNPGGVIYIAKRAKWWARIGVGERRRHLGYFDTEVEAHEARRRARSVAKR